MDNDIQAKLDGIKKDVDALLIERAGLQARLRAQEDPRDAQVINEATVRFLAIFTDPKPTTGTIQDRLGMAFRETLGILREASVAAAESTHGDADAGIDEEAVRTAVLGFVVHTPHRNKTVGARFLCALLGQSIGIERVVRAADALVAQGKLERLSDPVTGEKRYRCAPTPHPFNAPLGGIRAFEQAVEDGPKPSTEALAAAAFQDRVLTQRSRIVAAADNQPRSHNDLWRRVGSPQNDDSAAFDTALLQLAEIGKLIVSEDANPSRSKLYRLP